MSDTVFICGPVILPWCQGSHATDHFMTAPSRHRHCHASLHLLCLKSASTTNTNFWFTPSVCLAQTWKQYPSIQKYDTCFLFLQKQNRVPFPFFRNKKTVGALSRWDDHASAAFRSAFINEGRWDQRSDRVCFRCPLVYISERLE